LFDSSGGWRRRIMSVAPGLRDAAASLTAEVAIAVYRNETHRTLSDRSGACGPRVSQEATRAERAQRPDARRVRACQGVRRHARDRDREAARKSHAQGAYRRTQRDGQAGSGASERASAALSPFASTCDASTALRSSASIPRSGARISGGNRRGRFGRNRGQSLGGLRGGVRGAGMKSGPMEADDPRLALVYSEALRALERQQQTLSEFATAKRKPALHRGDCHRLPWRHRPAGRDADYVELDRGRRPRGRRRCARLDPVAALDVEVPLPAAGVALVKAPTGERRLPRLL
jgi:hypothetical protein